ncbi:MAG: hypothetical protein BM485_14655 [Desulfobulbaceae bacterium DB1]|nr:MAG: hypothetical protein BM485_14655 [Desulfobulbaceae bacterium DB1]
MAGQIKTRKQRRDKKSVVKAHGSIDMAQQSPTVPSLERTLGNQAMLDRSDKNTATEESVVPRIELKRFSPDKGGGSPGRPDKSTSASSGDQDQSASLTSFAPEARGVGIQVDIVGGVCTPTYPDGYRWTQTIDTNVPLGGTTSPYVDPRPNDDTKPFYWTDAEAAARPTTFIDHPSRNTPGSGVTTWDATLALNGVNNRTVTMIDSLSYGFSINSAGTVTPHYPICPGGGLLSSHQSTLSSEFPGWTFS